MNAVVSTFRWYDPVSWKPALHEARTRTIGGTSRSIIFSFSGYRQLSVSRGSFQCPR